MKKIIIFLTVLLLSTSLFAETKFFKKRIFEIYTSVPFSFSNNTFYLDDLLVENCVLDFGKIADTMPDSGFSTYLTADPVFGLNFNLAKFSVGLEVGLESYQKFTLPKGLFVFLGKGNELGEELDFAMKLSADTYADMAVNVQIPFLGGTTLKVTPSVFFPLLHVTTEDSKTTFLNTEDGLIKLTLDAQAKVYTCFGGLNLGNSSLSSFNFSNFNLDSLKNFNFQDLGLGFDIAGEISLPFKEYYELSAAVKIPVVPGHLKYVYSAGITSNFETKLTSLMNGGLTFESPAINFGSAEAANYAINRPLKLDVGFDMAPMGYFMHIYYGLGFGVRNPFTGKHESVFYPEYKVACTLKFDNIVGGTLGTEYTDEIFKHTLSLFFNVRILEIDAMVAFASPTIYGSVSGGGFAATIQTKIGF